MVLGRGDRWSMMVALLLCAATTLSAKKIIPIRPEARRKILNLKELANAQISKTGSGVTIELPGLSASLRTQELAAPIEIPAPLRNTSQMSAPDFRIVNQQYLPGSQTFPLNVTGNIKLSELSGTYRRKPAMVKGVPMPDDTGVSLYAEVVLVNPKKSQSTASREQGIAGLPQAGIKFHGGPVVHNPKVVVIYYGNWDTCNKAETSDGASAPEPSSRADAAMAAPLLDATATFSWKQDESSTPATEGSTAPESVDTQEEDELRPGSGGSNGTASGPANVACSNPATPVIFDDFVKSLDNTCWMNIIKTYYDKDGNFLSNRVAFGGSLKVPASDSCYQGSKLSDAQLFAVVTCLLDQKRVSYDPNTLYLVVTASETTLTSGFCSQYCGWHDHGTWQNNNVRYSFIGSALQCPSACMEQQHTSPNAIPELDGLVSIGAHEIVEWITDPDGDAWYDDKGSENADKCAWNFGTTSPIGNAYYNVG
eukprot:jgi/Botrbrau1/3289/Bobra.174_1s0053.1